MQTILPATVVSKWNLWTRKPALRKIRRETVRLKDSSTLSFREPDFTIRCLKGRLWVTFGDHGNDLVLSAGESISRQEPSLTVIEALGESAVEIVKR